MRIPSSPASTLDVSNALTYGSLCAGVCAFAAALQGSVAACGLLLATAVVLDTFDGRFARTLRARSGDSGRGAQIGEQLDSLVDAVTFGMVPVASASVLFQISGAMWWGAAFFYVACAVTRLGFYNLTHERTDGFIGLPAPVAGLFWSSMLLFQPGPVALTTMAAVSAAVMIAPVRIPRPTGAALALFVCWPAALIVTHCRVLLIPRLF